MWPRAVAASGRSSYRQKCSISYWPITLVGSSRMRATLTGRVFASLCLTFTPLSPTAHIAQWQDAPALCHRSWFRIPWWYYNFLSFFLFTSFSKSFFIVLFATYSVNVNFRHYLYSIMLTIWLLYFRAITELPRTHALKQDVEVVVRYVKMPGVQLTLIGAHSLLHRTIVTDMI